jgi:integrase/recombinase XerD
MGARGLSETTISNRRRMLGFLAEWLADRGVARPADVTKPMLDRYQRWLYHYRKADGDPLTFRSQHARLVAVRAFFKWAARQNLILYNPASELELPRLEKRLPKAVLTIAETEAVLAQPNLEHPGGLRDRAILEVFYSTGMRRMELAGLQLFDVDFDRQTIFVRQGKGRKDRMVPVGERALAWINRYLIDVRPRWATVPDDNWLFLTTDGTPFSPSRLTQMARNYIRASGVGKEGACHLFRHTMATLMLEGGADIRHIQAMLGHVRLETTEIYTQVSIRHLQQIHAACHPAANNHLDRDNDTQQFLDQALHGDDGEVMSKEELLAALETEIVLENRPHADEPTREDRP